MTATIEVSNVPWALVKDIVEYLQQPDNHQGYQLKIKLNGIEWTPYKEKD